jgi:hypothetical protein
MDAAYDVPTIIEHSQSLGHVPLIDKNPRRNKELKKALEAENLARKTLNLVFPETLRYNSRSTAERTNSRLKRLFQIFNGRFSHLFDPKQSQFSLSVRKHKFENCNCLKSKILQKSLHYNLEDPLKDEFGACKVRVRGHAKVACHLLFGVLTLAADQLMQLVI